MGSDIKTRKFKCTGCGETRPCHIKLTEQEYYDHNIIDNLKCVVDETNQTAFNWEEVERNDVKTGEKQFDFITNYLSEVAEKHNIPVDRLMCGVLNGDFIVWDYDPGRNQQDQFKTVVILPL